MRRLILGTAGHIDHGKTSLVHALTGIDTDRLPEEKRRGITIDLGFASLAVGSDTTLGIVDVPGHEAFIRNMLAGATGIDIALLVVAADEGVMPQTREHLAITELLGVRSLVVALTKRDLVSDEWLELVVDDIADLLAGGPFADASVVPVSARSGEGLDALRETLSTAAARTVERSDADLFRLPIDRVFTIRGTGTVVTGTVWSGATERDRSLRLLPGDLAARVRILHSHGKEQTRVHAGQRAALGLAGVDRDDVQRGSVLVEGAGWNPASILSVRIRTLPEHPPIRVGQRIRFHLGTAEVLGRVVPFDARPIQPGDQVWAQIRLESPVIARAGDRFVLRSYSPISTIAGGQIAEPTAPKRKRPGPDIRAHLGTILDGTDREAIRAVAALAGWTGLPTDQVAIRTRASLPIATAATSGPDHDFAVIGASVFHRAITDRAAELQLEAVDTHHRDEPLSPGFPREQLRQTLPVTSPGLADHATQRLVDEGRLELDGSLVRRSGHEPVLDSDQAEAVDELSRIYRTAGLASPTVSELPSSLRSRRDVGSLIRHLQRTKTLVPLGQGRVVDRDAIEAAERLLVERFAGREAVSPAEFREVFGLSRKYLIPVLEHFDRVGLTARVGESRRVEGWGRTSGSGA